MERLEKELKSRVSNQSIQSTVCEPNIFATDSIEPGMAQKGLPNTPLKSKLLEKRLP